LDRDTEPIRTEDRRAPGWVLGGRYRVLDRLGNGGMAEVFRAHDELLDRDVAVKVFKSPMDPDGQTLGEVRRELELQSLARLSHPNLITLFDGSVDGPGPAYLVLELVHGPDLATRLGEGPLPEAQVREIGAQLADALAYVHAHGMVHRDVKPANILLGVDDTGPATGSVRARLSDFGIVRMVGNARMTSADLTLGTATYIAPEQARGANVGPAADVYALGLVLIEALTGRRCFDGPVHETLAARLSAPPPIPDGLPDPWPALFAEMTAQDPGARPSALEVAHRLRGGTLLEVPLVGATTVAGPAYEAPGLVPVGSAATSAMRVADAAPIEHREKRRSRRGLGLFLLLGAVVLAGAVGIGGFLARGGGTGSSPPGTTSNSPAGSHAPGSTHASRHARTTQAAEVKANPPGGASRSGHHSRSAAHSKHASASTSQGSTAGRSAAPNPAPSTSVGSSSTSSRPTPTPTTPTPTPTDTGAPTPIPTS
jgi:serine/threonine protein kinase